MIGAAAVSTDHVSTEVCDAVVALLHEEAARLDDHDYSGWLELWAEECFYWIPADGEDTDPETHVSFVSDNRRRLEMRVAQLQTGYRYAQLPQSRTQHYVTNIQIRAAEDGEIAVRSSYLIAEARFGEMQMWPGKAMHTIVRADDGTLRIRRKTVILINNDLPVTAMGFLA